MNNTIKLKLDKPYFKEAFDQSIRYASKWRKFEWVIGLSFLCFGMYLIIQSGGKTVLPLILIFIGFFEVFNPFFKKIWWVGRQMKSKVANTEVTITFSENGITSTSDYSKGEFTWEGVERILETPKGVFIWPQKGMHMYFPKSIINNDIISLILSKRI